jgi:hypothetical protein
MIGTLINVFVAIVTEGVVAKINSSINPHFLYRNFTDNICPTAGGSGAWPPSD